MVGLPLLSRFYVASFAFGSLKYEFISIKSVAGIKKKSVI
jgi:hypothetical protein